MAAAPPVIALHDVVKTYRVGAESIRALRGISLTVNANKYVAIMGHSGSGKSTLMNILGCLDRPSTGRYELDGQDITKLRDSALAGIRNQRIGFVFQSFELLPHLTALKNAELPLLYSNTSWFAKRRIAAQALDRVGLSHRINHRPNQLSGGEKQRIAIARALICDPSILLADEPTGNLDTKTGDAILEVFAKLHAEGQTIIMVTHEEAVAAHTKRIIRMRDGQIRSDRPWTEDLARRALESEPTQP